MSKDVYVYGSDEAGFKAAENKRAELRQGVLVEGKDYVVLRVGGRIAGLNLADATSLNVHESALRVTETDQPWMDELRSQLPEKLEPGPAQ